MRKGDDGAGICIRLVRPADAYAVITTPNPTSVGLHEAFGYERIGTFRSAGYKLGAWHDVLWMRREIAPIAGEPVDPVPLDELDRATIGALLD